MKKALLFTAMLACSLHAAIAGSEDVPLLVSTQWLAEHLNDPNVVVLQICTNRREYNKGHIPGARFVWGQSFAPSNPDATSELPTIEQAASMLEEWGVSNDSHVVICGSSNRPTWQTRLFFTLEYFGLGNHISILDGGFDVWKKENRTVSTEVAAFSKGKITLTPISQSLINGEWLNKHLDDATVRIIDARDKRFFDGEDAGQSRRGHIPNAANIPYTTCLDSTGKFKDKASLAKMFADAGAKQGNHVVTYCHIGQQATVAYFVARLLGYNASVYDGSFEDWSGTEGYPVVTPPQKTETK
jgi:thiosulfate/3-mercaptopyruvate sulfurtransferase